MQIRDIPFANTEPYVAGTSVRRGQRPVIPGLYDLGLAKPLARCGPAGTISRRDRADLGIPGGKNLYLTAIHSVWRVPLLPCAYTLNSSTLKPVFFNRSVKSRSGPADHTANTPWGRSACMQHPNFREAYEAFRAKRDPEFE